MNLLKTAVGMKSDEMLDAMGNIDSSFIEETEKSKKKRTRLPTLLAACLAVILLMSVILLPLGKDGAIVPPAVDSDEPIEPVKGTEEPKPTEILYSELGIPDDVLPEEVTSVIEQTGISGDIVDFETYITTAGALDIIEGEITGIYAKSYDWVMPTQNLVPTELYLTVPAVSCMK